MIYWAHNRASLQQLAPLPDAEREAKAIGNLLGTKPLIGNEATIAAVKERLPSKKHIPGVVNLIRA